MLRFSKNGCKVGVLLFAILCALSGKAQRSVESQSLVWMRYKLALNTPGKWQFTSEVEERSYWFPWGQHQLLWRNRTLYHFTKNWTAGAGFTYFDQTLPENPQAKNSRVRTELRPQLEFINKRKYGDNWQLTHCYWLEIRYFERGSNFNFENLRLRYLIQASYALSQKWSLSAFNELHLNAGANVGFNIFNQNRIGGGFKWQALPKVGISLQYFFWYQQRASGIDFFSRDILRFTIHHHLKL